MLANHTRENNNLHLSQPLPLHALALMVIDSRASSPYMPTIHLLCCAHEPLCDLVSLERTSPEPSPWKMPAVGGGHCIHYCCLEDDCLGTQAPTVIFYHHINDEAGIEHRRPRLIPASNESREMRDARDQGGARGSLHALEMGSIEGRQRVLGSVGRSRIYTGVQSSGSNETLLAGSRFGSYE